MIKQIMIPVAAFAVTVTSASAFTGDMLDKLDVDLTNDQVAALEEAHELKEDGADREEIKEVLEDGGIDREVMQEIREAAREYRAEVREAVREAIEDEDYDAYRDAVADTRHADVIDSESDFERLIDAYELREDGDKEGAREIMEDLGFEKREHKFGKRIRNQLSQD